ncbi:MAG: dihydroorotate dehydrogenase electron transfer subunit [Acidobacteriota bacterium]|nr:dihydroorotate dehydrogenase electron transfer subunit [Acidobacteriota bacterium]
MPLDFLTKVCRNEDLGQGNFLLSFDAPSFADSMAPAEFFMIGIPGAETLLRRPFSVCGLPGTFDDSHPDRYTILVKAMGKGTRLLSELGPGAELTVLGPLGQGYSLPTDDRPSLIVAGGIGSAPFPALIDLLERNGHSRPHMIYGARSSGDLPLADWFADRCRSLSITTDDGSQGEEGRVTAPLLRMLKEHPGGLRIYACGPDPMLKAVAAIAIEAGVECQLALEAHMACGFGVCLGCVVPVIGEDGQPRYERVCVEGPVMTADRMAW